MDQNDILVKHSFCKDGKPSVYELTHIPTGKTVGRPVGNESSCVVVERLHSELADIVPPEAITLAPAWLTPTVQQFAAVIYEEREFDKLLLLGDALEEAGCDNADVLQHGRSGGEHVRGCWVVDKVLGKE